MLVEELGRQTDTGIEALVVVVFQRTVLVGIAHGHAVRHILQSTSHGEVVVCTHCHAVDFILPVGIDITQLESLRSIGILGKGFAIFGSGKYIQFLIHIAHRHVGTVAERGT